MSTGLCKNCQRMTNSATSDWWFTPDFRPTKCFVAWEKNEAVQGCAFSSLTKGAQFLYQETIDTWNKNSKKSDAEHIKNMEIGD